MSSDFAEFGFHVCYEELARALSTAVGVDLEFFTNEDGFVKPMAKLPGPAEEATWLSGATVIRDPSTHRERLFAGYARVRPGMVIVQQGLAEFDDTNQIFHSVTEFGSDPHVAPQGHPISLRDCRSWRSRAT